MGFDWSKTAEDDDGHRIGLPERLFDLLAVRGIGERGQKLVDLGTGVGQFARDFARRGVEVTAVDASEALIKAAKAQGEKEDLRMEYVVADAERTGLPAKSFDVVSAAEAWEWFDRPKAIREVKRLLKPTGWLVIASFDWLPLKGNVVAATEKLIEKYNPEWRWSGGTGMYPEWLRHIRAGGFRELETFSFDVSHGYTHEQWTRRVSASSAVRASLSPDEVHRFTETLRTALADQFPDEPIAVPHCCWVISARAPD